MPEKEFAPRELVLDEAKRLTMGDRNKTYGDPVDNMNHIAKLWSQTFGDDPWRKPFKGSEVAIMMAQVKIARLRTSPTHMDNYVDAAAYIAMAYQCALAEAERADASKDTSFDGIGSVTVSSYNGDKFSEREV